jgi:hypothetical protein
MAPPAIFAKLFSNLQYDEFLYIEFVFILRAPPAVAALLFKKIQ